MPAKRSYAEGCAASHALDVVGERWALLVVRELLFGPKRFTDLASRLEGASTSVLAQRLQDLVESGVIERRRLPPPAASWVYELTDWGRGLQRVLIELGRWGSCSTAYRPELRSTPAAVATSLVARFDPTAVGNEQATVGFVLDDEEFVARLAEGSLQIGPAVPTDVDAWISGSSRAMRTALHAGAISPQALRRAGLTIEGDAHQAQVLLGAIIGPEAGRGRLPAR